MPQRDLDLKGQESPKLLIEIRTLIEGARRQTAVAVNIGLTLLYRRIGRPSTVRCWAANAPRTAKDCRNAVATIELVPLQRAFAP
jgi:hypothetical protein